MKKISIILLSFMIFFISFGSSAFAMVSGGETGLTDSKDWYLTNNQNTTTLNSPVGTVTDNDPSTSQVLQNSSTTSNLDNLVYEFSISADFSSGFYYADFSRYTGVDFVLKDVNGVILAVQNLVSGKNSIVIPYGNTIDMTQIKRISLRNMSTTDTLTVNEIDFFGIEKTPLIHDEITNLVITSTHDSASLTWDSLSSNTDSLSYKVYRDGVLIQTLDKSVNSFVDSGLSASTTYSYKVTAFYSDSLETTGMISSIVTDVAPVNPSLVPPSNVTNLTVSDITGNSAKLTWLNPSDPDIDKINIYENGNLSTQLGIVSSYVLTGLLSQTNYSFSVSVVDVDGNESPLTPVSFTTLMASDVTPPDVPTGLNVTAGSNALYLRWDSNLESDLDGYNVYVNGVKYNSTLVRNTAFSVPNLTNGTSYDIQVTAVDTSGNESALTLMQSAIPISSGMPILGMDYDLVDVASAVSDWFTQYWLIIAFASAIPLSFYIASRLKLMFLE